jgi:5-methylcytosine-specific restriction enzyme A
MTRHEFSKATKREALARSGGLCEGVGEVYGLEPGQRCNAPLSHGVDFDHFPIPATDKGSDTADNCVACCRTCHRFKTSTYDVPMQAKGRRIRDKHAGIRKPSTLRSRNTFKPSAPNVRQIGEE